MWRFALRFYSEHVHELGRSPVIFLISVWLLFFLVCFISNCAFPKRGATLGILVWLDVMLFKYLVRVVEYDI